MTNMILKYLNFKTQGKAFLKPFNIILIFIILIYLAVVIQIKYQIFNPKNIISCFTSKSCLFSLNIFTKSNKTQSTPLHDIVDNILTGNEGLYGVAIENLKTGETYYSNEHKVFDTASLYKLWVMATAYDQIQTGRLKVGQVLSQEVAILNQEFEIDPNYAEKTEGSVTFTVSDALTKMITVSDNYAALLLSEKVTLLSIANYLTENGLNESTVGVSGGAPTATPGDIALFYKKLYQGELANKRYTDEMINLLKNQTLNNGLPKYLAARTQIAHKTGELGYLKHDAGIIYTAQGDYIIVVMTETDSPQDAQEIMALLSKEVFDYFTN